MMTEQRINEFVDEVERAVQSAREVGIEVQPDGWEIAPGFGNVYQPVRVRQPDGRQPERVSLLAALLIGKPIVPGVTPFERVANHFQLCAPWLNGFAHGVAGEDLDSMWPTGRKHNCYVSAHGVGTRFRDRLQAAAA